MRFILLGTLAVFLAGCALPPAVVIGSYAADGLSYLITGKSVSDHALSEVVGEDCATWRIVKLENPCREYEDDQQDEDDILLASVSPEAAPLPPVESVEEGAYDSATVRSAPVMSVTEVWTDPGSVDDSSPNTIETETLSAENDSAPMELAAAENAEPARIAGQDRGPPRTFFVIGSFSSKANADRLADTYGTLDPTVVSSRNGGVTKYRVVTRVGTEENLGAARRRLAAAGLHDVWPIGSCGGGADRADCLVWVEGPMARDSADGAVEFAAAR